MDGGILQGGGDLREVQIVLPDHLLGLLELDPAHILAGGDLQVLAEQGGQIAGGHIHMAGNQRHRQLFPDMLGDELLGPADDLIFGIDRIGGTQTGTRRADLLPQQLQQQNLEHTDHQVRGEGIHPLQLPEHPLQQRHCGLGDAELAIDELLGILAHQVEGDGDVAGAHVHIGILHMPLVGAVQHQITLLQQDVPAVGHGVQGALVHIGQLQGLMGLAGEGEALLLLLVEEGVDAADLDLAAEPELVAGIQTTHLLQLTAAGHVHAGTLLIRMNGKTDAGLDADDLVQIEMAEGLPLCRNGQHGHIRMVAQPNLTVTHIHRALAPDKIPDLTVFSLLGQVTAPDPLGFDDAVGLKRKLVQVADHISRLQKSHFRFSIAYGLFVYHYNKESRYMQSLFYFFYNLLC